MLVKKMFWFGTIGVINTAVDWTAFWCLGLILPNTAFAVWSAKAMSYGLGVISSYALNTNITFRHQVMTLEGSGLSLHSRLFVRFLIVSVACLVINSVTYTWLAGNQYMALMPLATATVVTYMIGFALNNAWTFRTR